MAKKISAAHVDALRWRVMFTEFGAALLNHHGIEVSALDSHYKIVLNEAALLADHGLKLFYDRYEKETEPKAPRGFIK